MVTAVGTTPTSTVVKSTCVAPVEPDEPPDELLPLEEELLEALELLLDELLELLPDEPVLVLDETLLEPLVLLELLELVELETLLLELEEEAVLVLLVPVDDELLDELLTELVLDALLVDETLLDELVLVELLLDELVPFDELPLEELLPELPEDVVPDEEPDALLDEFDEEALLELPALLPEHPKSASDEVIEAKSVKERRPVAERVRMRKVLRARTAG
jgi:hypothetical protein